MIVLGLTGSIGMGKSTVAQMLRDLGVPVHDADAAVHALLAEGGEAVAAVEESFPGVARDGAVDRAALGTRVFGDAAALKRLEAILHPMVRERTRAWLAEREAEGADLVVLDIPLLFESGGERLCDAVLVVTAPEAVQRERVMQRAGMDEARFQAILDQQMSDAEKRARADYVLDNGGSREETLRRLEAILKLVKEEHGGKK